MRKIQILGTGCPKCKLLFANTEAALKSAGLDAQLEKVEKIVDIMKFGVMTTPALVVDGKVKSAGRVLTPEDIIKHLNEEKQMSENPKVCGGAPKLIFPCSGGSDVGALSDLAARQMTRDGTGKMYCLTGIGGRVPGIRTTTESAAKILAIDGCPLHCAKKTLELAGFSGFEHLCLADIGFLKGQSPATPENIATVAQAAAPKLAG